MPALPPQPSRRSRACTQVPSSRNGRCSARGLASAIRIKPHQLDRCLAMERYRCAARFDRAASPQSGPELAHPAAGERDRYVNDLDSFLRAQQPVGEQNCQHQCGVDARSALATEYVVRDQRRPLQGAAHGAGAPGPSLRGLRSHVTRMGCWPVAARERVNGPSSRTIRTSPYKQTKVPRDPGAYGFVRDTDWQVGTKVQGRIVRLRGHHEYARVVRNSGWMSATHEREQFRFRPTA
jgi:hypothetical protein